MKKYIPIDCNKYDYLEIFALSKKRVNIYYMEDDQLIKLTDIINTISAKNKEEFLILGSGQSIRLDALVKVNDIDFKPTPLCTSCTNDTTFDKNLVISSQFN